MKVPAAHPPRALNLHAAGKGCLQIHTLLTKPAIIIQMENVSEGSSHTKEPPRTLRNRKLYAFEPHKMAIQQYTTVAYLSSLLGD